MSNESNYPVYFDNLDITHIRGPLLEEDHYYPDGLKMQGICSKAINGPANQWQYQGTFSDFDDLTSYNDFALRSYDAQVGRWTSQDPYDQFPSPYLGMGNNPVSYADPSGGIVLGTSGTNWGALLSGFGHVLAGAALDKLQHPYDWFQNAAGQTFWSNSTSASLMFNGVKYNNIGKTFTQVDANGLVEGFGNAMGQFTYNVWPIKFNPNLPVPSPVTTSIGPAAARGLSFGQQFQLFSSLTDGGVAYNMVNDFYIGGKTLLTPGSKLGMTDLGGDPVSFNHRYIAGVSTLATFLTMGIGGEAGGGMEMAELSDFQPTHYLTRSRSQMQSLMNDIRLNGIQEPLQYVESNGTKYIVNGNHRFFAAQKLGITRIPVQQVQLPFAGYRSTFDLMLTGKMPGYWPYIK